MNVTVVQKSATERELAIELPAADLEKAFEERLSEARKRIQLPGFRPGKTPKDLIRKRYGASLRGEAIDNLVQQSVRSACVQEKIVPVAPGDLSDFEAPEGGDVKFKVVVEVDPEIELQGYADLKFPVETKELEADEIEKALDSMRQRAAEVKDAERPSQVGDLVGATYKRIEIDGVERPLSAPAFQVEIGKGIPEVDAGLTGIVPGADVTIEFTFPDDYADESSRGKKGLYEVLVEKVLTRVIPELDEALAEKFGFKDLSELRARVETDLKATAERWEQMTGCRITEGYGLTETSPVACTNPYGDQSRIGTVGLPVPGTTLKVINDDGVEQPLGERGELCIKGPQIMKGYWQKPEATAEVLDAEGWFKSGDIAVIDPDGFVRIVDRKKDMIIVSGFNVYPNEIEDVVMAHPKVANCAVIGVPDERSGEAVKLFVVAREAGVSLEELKAYCKENFTAYKVPKHIVLRESLPMTPVGKILRRELRDIA